MQDFARIKRESVKFLLKDKEKEWKCHVQFVRKIALDLQKRFGGNKQVIELAAILHDIGRDREKEGEDHRITGAREASSFLDENKVKIAVEERKMLLKCIKNHGNDEPIEYMEEKIIITADSASKVLYHSAFMLMVKKNTFLERAEWGLKYLEKGYKKILFADYKKELKPTYLLLKNIYKKVVEYE